MCVITDGHFHFPSGAPDTMQPTVAFVFFHSVCSFQLRRSSTLFRIVRVTIKVQIPVHCTIELEELRVVVMMTS